MRPASRHPLVQGYFAELREASAELGEEQRAALLTEAVQQLNASLLHASTDSEIRAVIATFASPTDVVAATVGPQQVEVSEQLPSGALGLYLSIVGMVFVFLPWVGAAVGAVGFVVSGAAVMRRRRAGAQGGLALGGLAAGAVAVVLPLVLLVVFSNLADSNETPTPNTITVGGP